MSSVLKIIPSSWGGRTLQGTRDTSSWAAGRGCPDCGHSSGAGDRGLAPSVRSAPPPTVRWPPRLLDVLFCSQCLQLQGAFQQDNWETIIIRAVLGELAVVGSGVLLPPGLAGCQRYHLRSHLLSLGEKQQQMLSRWAPSSLHATFSPLILPAPLVSQKREHVQEKAHICVSSSPAPVAPFLHPDHPSEPGWHGLSSGTLRCHGSPASQQD